MIFKDVLQIWCLLFDAAFTLCFDETWVSANFSSSLSDEDTISGNQPFNGMGCFKTISSSVSEQWSDTDCFDLDLTGFILSGFLGPYFFFQRWFLRNLKFIQNYFQLINCKIIAHLLWTQYDFIG